MGIYSHFYRFQVAGGIFTFTGIAYAYIISIGAGSKTRDS